LRLMSYNQPLPLSFSLPKKLKKFYGYVGIIRNLQLQQESIKDYCSKSNLLVPGEYLNIIAEEEKFWRNEARLYIDDSGNFYDDEQSVLDTVPAGLKAANAKQFIIDKVAEIKTAIHRVDDDESLHKIRKLFKDVLFNWKYLGEHVASLPAGIQDEHSLQSLSNSLGQFRDICIAINHLQAAYIDRIKDADERQLLLSIEQVWQQQKSTVKVEVISLVSAFDFAGPQRLSIAEKA
jgi:hypothetical protein